MPKEYSEEIKGLLKQVADNFDKEDRFIRERQIRTWRRLKLFWDGFQRTYYSEVAHDWRVYDPQQAEDDAQQSYYDKPINVFKAYLESIIAALSVTVPPVKCYPDDADNPNDLNTAKAGDKIAQLIYRHNDVPLLWLNALYVFCTEGMVAAYNYTKEDESYGTYEQHDYEEVPENHQITTCPLCGMEIEDKIVDSFDNIEKDEFAPGPDDVALHSLLNQGMEVCPNCAQMIDPEIRQSTTVVTRLVGTTHQPKARQCIECYGGLYVKIPSWAKKQKDIPYLIYSYETHYTNVIERFPHLYDKLRGSTEPKGTYDAYEAWGRLSTQYLGAYPRDTVTVRNNWFRPSAFNILPEEDSKKLKELFPDGCRVVFANDEFCEATNECLDDCWTLTYNPLTDYLQHDPLGLLLTSIQEITNDLVSLTLQTVEHGIPQTFVDKGVLDFQAYRNTEVAPGMIFPVTAKSGKSIGDSFYEVKTATLSGEVMPFGEKIQSLGQLVSGALPSLFGGQMSESKTASEYSMSRAQALQRLQNTWKIFTYWWKNIFGKVIPAYLKCIQEDEREVEMNEFGNFVNTYIRYAELQGKIGRVELEANENLPMTWQQKKDVVMMLLQSGNPEILAILGAPENLPVIREAIGLTDFFVPGEDDREAEYEEIKQLVSSEPIVIPPSIDPMMAQTNPEIMMDPMAMQAMQPQEIPSVEVDAELDNHQIRLEIDRSWLVSPAGRLAKVENPQGYKNVLLHAKMHMMFMMPAQPSGGAAPNAKPNENTQTPIQNESDVNVG